MASYNRVILIGNLTRDPQVKRTPAGSAVAEIGLAMNRYWFDKQTNQKREETTFVEVTLWGRDAEHAGEYLTKGKPVMIEGRLQFDSWEDKQTGQKRSRLRVVCERMQFIGSRDGGGGGGGSPRGGSAQGGSDSYGGPPVEEYGGDVGSPSGNYGGNYGGGNYGGGGFNAPSEPPQDDIPF